MDAREIDALVAALEEIAFMGLDMPAAYNNEEAWYRGRAYNAVGTAARALAAHRAALATKGIHVDTEEEK